MERQLCRAGGRCLLRSVVFSALILLPFADGALAGALDRIKGSGKIMLGYRTDARPFSYQDDTGKAQGFAVDLCQKIADEVKTELALQNLAVEWVPIKLDERVAAVQQGKIDLLCGADTVTLAGRKDVSFSTPIFPSGTGAILRQETFDRLRDVLAGEPGTRPIWRGSPALVLKDRTFSVVKGTTSESWLGTRRDQLQISATIMPVETYEAGIKSLLDRTADVFFGDRSILLEAVAGGSSAGDLVVLERLFTFEPIALTLARGDEDFRLTVDRSLNRTFGSPDFSELYRKWFGIPDETTLVFYQFSVLPE